MNPMRSVIAGQVAEHHERVVERVVLRVRAGERRRPVSVHRTEHVVVGQEVVEAKVFDRFPDPANRFRVAAKLDLGIHDTYLHSHSLPRTRPVITAGI